MDAHPSPFPSIKPFAGVLLILLLSLLLTGCKMDPNETFVQGQWYDNNDHLSNLAGESRQESFWYFDNKTFEVYGCCFVPMEFSGNYRILKSEGDTLQLELYQLQGQNSSMLYHSDDVLTITITINRQTDTIQFGGGDPFTRVLSAP
ncbi:MAG TPA: hypothetical protein VLM83_04300 [Anaerolineales bacterium]|nr:hypothetical protein [Anaerolineales bacterium]